MIAYRLHTDAVIAALETAGLTVGDAKVPNAPLPHAIVYPIPGGDRSGSLANPYEDAEFVFQVTCVGTSREQAQWLADKAEAILDGVTVTGRTIHPSPDSNPGVFRDDDVTPPVFYCTPRYRLKTTPS